MRKSNKKWIIISIIILVLAAVGIVYLLKHIPKNNAVNIITIKESDIVYYKIVKDQKYGVIKKDGTVVIEPQYANIIIPNPTTDLFLCSNDNENSSWNAYNSKKEQVLSDYKEIEPITINQLSSIVPYEKTVLKYKDGNQYGLIDFTGKKISQAEYEEIVNVDYKEGYLKVKKNGSYGIITIDGKKIINCEYNDIISDGYYNEKTKYTKSGFLVQIKGDDGYKYGYINTEGKEIVDSTYSELSRINEYEDEKTVYLISKSNGKTGLIKNGKQVIENELGDITYDRITNLLVVGKGTKFGVETLEGKQIVPIEYDYINVGGEYINAIKGNIREVFDTNGNKIDTKNSSYQKVSKNYGIVIDEENNYNIVDSSGKPLLSEKYVYIEYFKNDLFIVTKDGLTGLVNANGNVVVPLKYSSIQRISDSEMLEAIILENNQVDLIDASGKVTTGFENAKVEKKDDFIRLIAKDGVKYFDLNGNEKKYQDFESNNQIFASCNNGKWGFVDSKGNVVVDYIYDMVTEQNGNTAGVKTNDLWGVIDVTGKTVLAPTYKIEWDNVNFISTYYETSFMGEHIYSADVIE